jgi:DNA-binding MarR family transcriptional regulator
MNQPAIEETIDKFWDFFPPVWHVVKAHIRHEATENFEITVGQFHILRRIRTGIDSVSTLAEDRRTTRPATSRTVDILVHKGWVSRSQNPDDRRYVQLSLTTEGQALLDKLFTNTRTWMAAKLADLNDEEIEAILVAGDALKRAFTEKTGQM